MTVEGTFQSPDITLSVNGELVKSDGALFGEPLRCDVLPAVTEGYSKVEEGGVMEGAVYPVYATWFVPEGATVDYVVVGNSDTEEPAYFAADVSTDTVAPPDLSAARLPDVAAVPVGTPTDVFFDGQHWSMTLDGLEPAQIEGRVYGQELFSCYVVIGEVTLLEMPELMADDTLRFRIGLGLLGEGRFRDGLGVNNCDEDPFVNRGLVELGTTDLAPGETVRFYEPIYLEDTVAADYVATRSLPEVFFELPE